MAYLGERDRYEQYLQELIKDREKLSVMEGVFIHCLRLVELEIDRVNAVLEPEADTVPPGTENDNLMGNPAKVAKVEGTDTATVEEVVWDPDEPAIDKLKRLKQDQQMIERVAPNVVRIFEKVFLPQRQYTSIKYPGRIIGPGGSTVKEINNLTGCKLLVRGKGSFKVPHQEESMKTVPGFEHLDEEMHVLIEASGSESEANSKMQLAKQIVIEIIPPEINPPDIIQKYATWGRYQFLPNQQFQFSGQMPPQPMNFQGGYQPMHQGYPMNNMPHQGPPMQGMGYNQGGNPLYMGAPQNPSQYGFPQGGPQFVSQQYGSQQYGYSHTTAAIPPYPAVTLPSLPRAQRSSVTRPHLPPPPGVDPPHGEQRGSGEDSGGTQQKNSTNMASHVSTLPSQSYFSNQDGSHSPGPRPVIPVTQPAALVGIDVDLTQNDN